MVKLRKRESYALGLIGDGRPIYRFSDGPRVLKPDGSWATVAASMVARLEKGGLVAPVETTEGRVAYWTATEDGRAKEGEEEG
jgi:hypothetical protein